MPVLKHIVMSNCDGHGSVMRNCFRHGSVMRSCGLGTFHDRIIFAPKRPCIHRMYIYRVLANSIDVCAYVHAD
jgi:hypothetical protein